ncbi:MAG: glycosyltransferase [Candidatus Methylumidiphilus sp.]
MKILHVEMGRQLDGAARQVAYLLNGMEKFPAEHTLVCANGSELIGALSNRSVKTIRIKPAEEKGMKFMGSLRKIIRYEKPDFLHIHGRPGDGWAAWAGKLEKKPLVYSLRVDVRPNVLQRYLKYSLCSQVITMSQSIRKTLQEARVAEDKLVPIAAAVDSARFKPGREQRDVFLTQYSIRSEGPVLGVAAQWIASKGISTFFGALPAVIAKHPGTRALVFGRGPLKDELTRELNRRGLEKYVRLVGFVPDLENVLPHLDLLVHPALDEGMGVVLLEASACGVPIVASRVGGIADIVRDRFNGFLVKPGDSLGLARHIVDLWEDQDQWRLFGRTGREIAVENFGIERLVNAHRDVYRNV